MERSQSGPQHQSAKTRRDTCEAFKDRYLEHHSKEEPKSSPPPATPVLLKEDLWAETLSGETELASLSLRTGQSEPVPGEAMLGFDLNCPRLWLTDSRQASSKAF